MVKVDLITGFLGAGKTTFIKKYAKYLIDSGLRIGIIENDFGAVNVDMMLLQDIMGENCELEMISGGCHKDCHRRRFKTKLISMGMCGYDRVLVEPSGIFDVEEFFDILHEEPLDSWYEIGNVIAIVDAGLDDKLSAEAEYIMTSQIADAGKIILSKVGEVSKETMEDTVKHLNRSLQKFKCKKSLDKEVLCKDWEKLTEQDFEDILKCGYKIEDYEKLWFENDEVFESVYYMNVRMSKEELKSTAEKLMSDDTCGNVIRIKGFMLMSDGGWIEINAARKRVDIKTVKEGQEILIVIGEKLIKDIIGRYFGR